LEKALIAILKQYSADFAGGAQPAKRGKHEARISKFEFQDL